VVEPGGVDREVLAIVLLTVRQELGVQLPGGRLVRDPVDAEVVVVCTGWMPTPASAAVAVAVSSAPTNESIDC
jgi:hypothetical protein